MNDFMNKVQQLVKIWNAAAAEGLNITDQVADKIRSLSVQLLDSGTFLVTTHVGNKYLPVLNSEEIGFIKSGKKLEAIKLYRNRCGDSLVESKNAIDQYCRNNGL
jgi:hypothetical protein